MLLEDVSVLFLVFFKLSFITIGLILVISGIINIGRMTVTAGVELPLDFFSIVCGLIILYFTDFFHYISLAWQAWN